MKTAWTQNIKDPQEKVQFEASIRHAKWILDHLNRMLSQMDQDFERAEINPKIYDSPNWEFRQAHANGYRQCLKQIQQLLILDRDQIADPKDTNERK